MRRNYQNEDIADASFAIVAFLDEAILSSSDPARTQWAKQYLLEETIRAGGRRGGILREAGAAADATRLTPGR